MQFPLTLTTLGMLAATLFDFSSRKRIENLVRVAESERTWSFERILDDTPMHHSSTVIDIATIFFS